MHSSLCSRLFGVLLLLLPAFQATAQTPGSGKLRALLIGNSAYSEDSGWAPLHAHEDLKLIETALERRGFWHIDVVEDVDHVGLVDAFAELTRRAREGDQLYIHYSGYGQQVLDDNGDEADGFDEALVPVDAPRSGAEGYAGELHLRDDELSGYLTELRDKVGEEGSLTVVLDTCSTPDAPRSLWTTRCGAAPIGGEPETTRDALSGSDFLESLIAELPTEVPRAPLVVLSAAHATFPAHEVYFDDAPHGAMTVAVASALGQYGAESWASVHERVRVRLADLVPGQISLFQGEQNASFFGGETKTVPPYLRVKFAKKGRTSFWATGGFRFEGGELMGHQQGSHAEVHSPGDEPPGDWTRLTGGPIVQVNAVSSRLELSTGAPAILPEARVFITRPILGDLRLKVGFDVKRAATRRSWEKALGEAPLHRMVVDLANPDVVLVQHEGTVHLALPSDLDSPITSAPLKALPLDSPLASSLHQLSYGHLVDALELNQPLHAVQAEVRSARRDGTGGCRLGPARLNSGVGKTELLIDQHFLLQITHTGTEPSYVTIMRLAPGGSVTQLWPAEGVEGKRLMQGDAPWVVPICLTPPAPGSQEKLKVFATEAPLDFSPLLGMAPTSDTDRDGLQALIDELGERAISETPSEDNEDGFTYEVVYTVEP